MRLNPFLGLVLVKLDSTFPFFYLWQTREDLLQQLKNYAITTTTAANAAYLESLVWKVAASTKPVKIVSCTLFGASHSRPLSYSFRVQLVYRYTCTHIVRRRRKWVSCQIKSNSIIIKRNFKRGLLRAAVHVASHASSQSTAKLSPSLDLGIWDIARV